MRGVVLIAAGGTGGHLFPAEALAAAMNGRGWRVHLATDRRAESYGHAFPAEAIHIISSATPSGSPRRLAGAVLTLARGMFEARALIHRLRPDVAAGFGGYPTVPPMLMAAWSGVPTVIHEQNAVLGRANRFLAPRVDCIATSVAGLGGTGRRRVVETGNPIRAMAREAAKIPYPARTTGARFRLLVFGGGQGARFLSDLMPAAMAELSADLRGRVDVVQQCRPEDMERVGDAYRAVAVNADLKPFFADLPQRMADSHLVVCRSGASTCAELAVIGRPAIMVPLPGALDQDQKANAQVLAKAGGGWLVEQKDMNPKRLADELAALIEQPERLAAAAAAARSMARPDAVERLADLVERVAGREPNRAGTTVPA